MDYCCQVYRLSAKFRNSYPNGVFPELMCKQGCPYTCLLIESHDGYFICVPFRSNITHKNAFLFKRSARSRRTKSGLDYSKTVIITNTEYIDSSTPAVVDQDEYREILVNLPRIVSEVNCYLTVYMNHIQGKKIIHPRDFMRLYGYSTLKYFHNELGLCCSPEGHACPPMQ